MATAMVRVRDERLARIGRLDRLAQRPELGSVLGAVMIFVFFSVITDQFFSIAGAANWLDYASSIGIMAVAVSLLMIGGEFDLSAGVMTATTALVTAILSTEVGMNVWPALVVSLAVALLLGAFNGWLVVGTGLPSFIVTLGTFLALQGANLGVTRMVTGTVQVSGIRSAPGYASAGRVLASTVTIGGQRFQIAIVWFAAVTAFASWLLLRTRFGNWVFAVGGAAASARSVGVPVRRTTILLFMGTASAAWLVGSMQILRYTSVQANQGIGEEFLYIIAAVIGGCLLTGGFGSAVGAAIGALIFGMANQGIVYARWNSDWFMLFLGVLLLVAVLVNKAFALRAERSRR